MQKLLPAFLVSTACTGVAMAQPSVTIYGTLDINIRSVKADGLSRSVSEAGGSLNSSVFGLRGAEDLGGGLSAGFNLEGDVSVDTGVTGAGSKFWNRRSTLSLVDNRLGELRLGRDYIPTFWTQGIFDAFGIVGLGASANVRQLFGGVRMDNSVGYFLPSNLGGLFGQAMVAASEGGTALDRPGRHLGGRVGYAAGPLNVAVAYARQNFGAAFAAGTNGASAVTTASPGAHQNTFNVGASWDFGVVKLMAYYDRETLNDLRENMRSVSASIPLGPAQFKLGYDRSELKATTTTTVEQFKASYVYSLSKRTALYSTVSHLTNRGGSRLTLAGAEGPTSANGSSTGLEFGIRHFF